MNDRSPHRRALLDALNTSVRRFTNHVTFYSEAVASQAGLHPTDLDCLSVIELDGPLTAGRLAEITGLTTGAVTGVIDRLERSGHVRREPDTTDRRRVLVRVVPDSARRVGESFVPMRRATEQMCDRYSDEELAVITDFATRAVPVLREESLRMRESDPNDAGTVSGSHAVGHAGTRNATLRIQHGAARLSIVAALGQPELFSAQWWGARPTVKQEADGAGAVVTVQYRRSPFGHFRTRGQVVLDAGSRWQVEINGGCAHSRFDLSATRVERVTFNGGTSSLDIDLPAATGRQLVEINGGAHAVTITRPAGVPTRLVVNGGASNLVLDDQRFGGVGGRTELHDTTAGNGNDQPSLEVRVRGGASSLSVIRRPPTPV
jgi:DNA-binding MarR family transcriptional regulator